MDDADDVLRIVLEQRHAGVGRVQRLGDQLARRQVGVEHGDGLAVDHDLRDVHLREIEHGAQHAPVAALHRPFLVVEVDRATDLLVGGEDVGLHVDVDAEQLQRPAHDPLDGVDDRVEQLDEEQHEGREAPRHVVGAGDGQGLGQHLDEHQHEHGHHRGGDDHAERARHRLADELGGEGRAQDVDQVVAEQHRPDHALAVAGQPVDPLGGLVPVLLQLVHATAAGGGQGGLGGREQGRDREQHQDDQEDDAEGHGRAPSSIRKSFTSPGSTSLATKA